MELFLNCFWVRFSFLWHSALPISELDANRSATNLQIATILPDVIR